MVVIDVCVGRHASLSVKCCWRKFEYECEGKGGRRDGGGGMRKSESMFR